ncbi:MAG: TIGR03086 family metal-binding protein [Segniliparus sp.]|uniref:TIGR03086 family metal-binding protein n=1 Tax=Segniliparus sp. TaxID=2804064 RepID=UPI003F31DFE9
MSADSLQLSPLGAAGDALDVLRAALTRVGEADLDRPTPNAKFTVAQLAEHLSGSVKLLGGAAGAEIDVPAEGSLEDQLVPAGQAALAAWQARGLDGTAVLPFGEVPAVVPSFILTMEFLVHAWDFATAVGGQIAPTEALTEFALGAARGIIRPELRDGNMFAAEVPVAEDAPALVKLIAFTGRDPRWSAA